jgi:hypothetical protein
MQPAPDASPSPSPEAVRQELHRILSSPIFRTAARSQRFLTYVVEQTLAGRQDAIKELVLGPEVFDRPGTFDPREDTIVQEKPDAPRRRVKSWNASPPSPGAVTLRNPTSHWSTSAWATTTARLNTWNAPAKPRNRC